MESVPDNIRSQVAAVAIDQANYLLGTKLKYFFIKLLNGQA